MAKKPVEVQPPTIDDSDKKPVKAARHQDVALPVRKSDNQLAIETVKEAEKQGTPDIKRKDSDQKMTADHRLNAVIRRLQMLTRSPKRWVIGGLGILGIIVFIFVIMFTEVEQEKEFKDTATNMEFVFVKGGCFEMGDTFRDGDADEIPVHEVCVNDFYIGKYEVTQGQWQAVMENNPSYSKDCGASCAVENVSWNDTQIYIRKLNERTGKSYRLPTEAEWEYAARSGGKMEKYGGTSNDSELGDYAWYDENSGGRTHPVGEKKPNNLELYDMTGNVWEWCQDWYGKEYYSDSPKDNPQGPASGSYRVLRGGYWYANPLNIRATKRSSIFPEYGRYYVGFRLSLSAP